jgi:hypothetical protein
VPASHRARHPQREFEMVPLQFPLLGIASGLLNAQESRRVCPFSGAPKSEGFCFQSERLLRRRESSVQTRERRRERPGERISTVRRVQSSSHLKSPMMGPGAVSGDNFRLAEPGVK